MKLKKFASLMLSVLLCFSLFAGCNKKQNDPDTLNIVVYDGGYGSDWLYSLIDIFEKDHPGKKVNPTLSKNAQTIISRNMNSKDNIDDLYISIKVDWEIYAPQGKLASLDPVFESTVDDVKIADKVVSAFQNSTRSVCKGEEHHYRAPWTAGVGGLFYNAEMFEENHWSVPQTYEELTALCKQIAEANIPVEGSDEETVVPFVFAGSEETYWNYLVFNWWGQISGKAEIDDFLKYEDKACFDPSDATYGKAYAGLKQAYTLWYDLIAKNPSYVMKDCVGKTYMGAQLDFVNGKAAMMPNGQWLYNEMKKAAPEFRMKIMPTPTAPNAQFPDTNYVVGSDQSIVIPATSTKQDLAMDFIRLMASDTAGNIFLKQANGTLGFNCDFDTSDELSEFQQSIATVQSNDITLFSDYSNTLLGKSGQISSVYAMKLPYNDAVSGYNSADPTNSTYTPDRYFNDIKSTVNGQWQNWLDRIS